MSLKKFHIFFVLFSLLAMLLLYLYISNLLQVNIDKNVKDSIHSTAIELRQQLRNDFSTVQQRFSIYEETSLEKLYELSPHWPISLTFAMLVPMLTQMKEDGKKVVE